MPRITVCLKSWYGVVLIGWLAPTVLAILFVIEVGPLGLQSRDTPHRGLPSGWLLLFWITTIVVPASFGLLRRKA